MALAPAADRSNAAASKDNKDAHIGRRWASIVLPVASVSLISMMWAIMTITVPPAIWT